MATDIHKNNEHLRQQKINDFTVPGTCNFLLFGTLILAFYLNIISFQLYYDFQTLEKVNKPINVV